MALLHDIRNRLEAVFISRTGTEPGAPSKDGMYDPLGDAELLTPERRGSMNKDTNGRLYYPTTDGYQRVKSITRNVAQIYDTTTDDTAVVYLVPSTPIDGSTLANRFTVAYQSSGAPLILNIWANAGKTQLLYRETIATATVTVLGCLNILFPSAYVAWAGAAGATQYIAGSKEVLKAVATV